MTDKKKSKTKILWLIVLISIFSDRVNATLPDFTDLVDAVAPAVVKINTVSIQKESNQGSMQGQMPEIFRELLEQRRRPTRPARTMGSGFVISGDGYILTNHHVVSDADEIQVQFADRSEYMAKVIGSDRRSDLALLKIEAEGLPSLEFAESENIKVGSWVIAIGSPFGLDYSVTAGIVSALGRSLPTEQGENYVPFIQTDVAINRGNSGGPLFNLNGKVVGINSQIYSPTGGSVGLSFSIPVSIARNVVDQLKDNGKVNRGFLGVSITDVDKNLAEALGLPGPMGAAVSQVTRGSAADQAGILGGDIIVTIDGNAILRSGDLPHVVGLISPGTEVEVEVYREGRKRKLEVEVGSLDGDEDIRLAGDMPSDRLGLVVEEIESVEARQNRIRSGLKVISLETDSAADVAGLRVNDIIVQIGYNRISNLDEYETIVRQLDEGTPIALRFYRSGQAFFTTLEID